MVDLSDNQIVVFDFNAFGKLAHLEHLSLAYGIDRKAEVTGDFGAIPSKSLASIDVSGTELMDDELKAFPLQVAIVQRMTTGVDVALLATMTQLKQLDLKVRFPIPKVTFSI